MAIEPDTVEALAADMDNLPTENAKLRRLAGALARAWDDQTNRTGKTSSSVITNADLALAEARELKLLAT